MAGPLISNVSDTARWVAANRAWESARPDALFRDPLAARLAGERGEQIARRMARGATANGWPMITRTKLIDDMVSAAVADGCTSVLNLAAGFDTRPYRLDLSPDLQWVEADLPALLDEKERLLSAERPRCSLERVRVDLSDTSRRTELFDRVEAMSKRVLIITEGLVLYLDDATVAALANDLLARPSFAFWVVDFSSPAILKLLRRGRSAELANAPFLFGPPNGVAFFEALGWHTREVRSLFHEGARLRRVPWLLRPLALFPPADARAPGDKQWSAVVRFAREAD